MAFAASSHPVPIFSSSLKPHHIKLSRICLPLPRNNKNVTKFESFLTIPNFTQKGHLRTTSFQFFGTPKALFSSSISSPDDEILEKTEALLVTEGNKPVKFLLWVVLWASVSIGIFAFSKDANAAVDSIKASGFGLKVASSLRGLAWPDEAVVLALATLPVIELRGAIPVGYWLQLNPVLLTFLAVLGNMVPVPFIILYLKKFANFMAGKNQSASQFLEMIFEKAREKAGPVKEFQWLGLMLFVAVPFPGTGAWTGAIIASILDIPFWSALSANFVGVVFAGLIVNFLVNLGLKYAIMSGIVLFIISTFMWSILRNLKRSLSSAS